VIHDDGNCYVPKCPSCGAPARFLEPVDGYIECWMCLIRWEADEEQRATCIADRVAAFVAAAHAEADQR
jgi:hypothetical protein